MRSVDSRGTGVFLGSPLADSLADALSYAIGVYGDFTYEKRFFIVFQDSPLEEKRGSHPQITAPSVAKPCVGRLRLHRWMSRQPKFANEPSILQL